MTDVALKQFTAPDGDTTWFDIAIEDGDLATDNGMETAVILSLHLDARSEAGERGWWADALDDDHTGSLLWQSARSKTTNEVLQAMQETAEAALQWMIDDGVAKSVQVLVSRGAQNQRQLAITITRSNNRLYTYNWQSQAIKG